MAMTWKIKRWSPKNAVNIAITIEGMTMPVITDDKLKVKNLENS